MQDRVLTSRPILSVDGQLSNRLTDGLKTLVIDASWNEPASCRAVFSNWGAVQSGVGYQFPDLLPIRYGSQVEVDLPLGSEQVPIFTGKMWVIETNYPAGSPPEVGFLAYDDLGSLAGPRRSRNFQNKSFGDIINQVLSEQGLQVALNLTSEDPFQDSVSQFMESDLEFVSRLAASFNWQLHVEDHTVYVEEVPSGAQSIQLAYGRALQSFSVRADLLPQRSEIALISWDDNKSTLFETAGESVLGSAAGELTTGADLVASVFGTRRERIPVLGTKHHESLQGRARGDYRRLAEGFIAARGICTGNPHIRPGVGLTISGLGEPDNGDYLVRAVRHTFDVQEGFRTEFYAGRAGLSSVFNQGKKARRRPVRPAVKAGPHPTDTTVVSIQQRKKED